MEESSTQGKKGGNKMFVVGAVLVVLLIAGAFFFSLMGNKKVSSPTTAPGTEVGSSPAPAEIQEITIDAKEYSFSLSSLILKGDQKVRIIFTNSGKMPHDLVIEELDLRTKVINSGQSDTLEFTTPTSGNLTIYCSIGNHRKLGMEGSITIE